MSSYLVVLVELHDRAVAATAPAVQVELELDVKYRTNGGDNLVHILSRYPDICKRTVVVSVLSYSDIFQLTIFRLTLDYVLVDDRHSDSGLRLWLGGLTEQLQAGNDRNSD